MFSKKIFSIKNNSRVFERQVAVEVSSTQVVDALMTMTAGFELGGQRFTPKTVLSQLGKKVVFGGTTVILPSKGKVLSGFDKLRMDFLMRGAKRFRKELDRIRALKAEVLNATPAPRPPGSRRPPPPALTPKKGGGDGGGRGWGLRK